MWLLSTTLLKCDFMGGIPSLYVTTPPHLVAIGIVVAGK